MKINPFKETNLEDLQRSISKFLIDRFGKTVEKAKELWEDFVKKGRERITIMFIPHSEKKIINFQVSIFAISGFVIIGLLCTIFTISSIFLLRKSTVVLTINLD